MCCSRYFTLSILEVKSVYLGKTPRRKPAGRMAQEADFPSLMEVVLFVRSLLPTQPNKWGKLRQAGSQRPGFDCLWSCLVPAQLSGAACVSSIRTSCRAGARSRAKARLLHPLQLQRGSCCTSFRDTPLPNTPASKINRFIITLALSGQEELLLWKKQPPARPVPLSCAQRRGCGSGTTSRVTFCIQAIHKTLPASTTCSALPALAPAAAALCS